MPRSEEFDWIFDYTLQFLESDKFDAAIMDFVDEKCLVFEDEEENKLIYTEIHREFVEHVEALIATYLADVGVTTEMFLESCEKARSGRDINVTVFERLTAMEDFQTFKKLMIKRNLELQLESIRSFRTATVKPTISPSKTHRLDAKDDSKDDAKDAKDSAWDAEDLEWMQTLSLNETDFDQLSEEEIQELLLQSLVEMEILHHQEALEAAELEQALRLSLAAAEDVSDRKESAPSPSPSAAAASAPAARDAKSNEPVVAERKDRVSSRPVESSKAEEKLAPLKPLRGTLNPLPPLRSSLPPLSSALSSSLSSSNGGSEAALDRAERALQQTQQSLAAQKDAQQSLSSQLLSSEEMEARAEHMRRQREKLLAMKKAERAEKVQRAEAKEAKEERPRFDTDQKRSPDSANDSVNDEVAEARRQQLRLALARRLKADVSTSSADAKGSAPVVLRDLDERLAEVETMREEHRRREIALQKALERQRETLARGVEQSAASLKRDGR